jgi:hypothetical protein
MHYPPYHHRHLYHWETLADIGASDASILYLHIQISSSAILYYVSNLILDTRQKKSTNSFG